MGKNADFIRNETIFGVAPLLDKDRKYSFFDSFIVTSGFAIATWCYSQGAYTAGLLSFQQMLISIFCVSLFWIAIECLPVLFAVRYGIDLWVWLRAALGKNGVRIFSTVVILANFGWYAVACDMFRDSIVQLCANFGLMVPGAVAPWIGVICVVIGLFIAFGGPEVIKWSSRIMVISLVIVGIIVAGICFGVSPTDLFAIQPDVSAYPNTIEPMALSNEGMVAFAFSWSTQALVLPRLCKSERSGYWSTFSAYGIMAPLFVLLGGIMALVMFATVGEYVAEPTTMLSTLCGSGVALLALIMVAIANISTLANGLYVNDLVLKAGWPKVPYKVLTAIMAVYISVLTLWGGVSDNFGAFISLAAYIQGPIIGIILVDCFFLRKRKLSLKAAYFLKGHTAYNYNGGFNLIGIISIIVGLICGLFIYNPMTGVVTSPIFYVTTGSGFTALCGGLCYLVLVMTPWGRKYSLRDREDLEIV